MLIPKVFLNNRIERNYKGLKVTAHMLSWGKLGKTSRKQKTQKRYKNVTNHQPLLSAGSRSRVLPVIPTRSTTKGAGGPLSPVPT